MQNPWVHLKREAPYILDIDLPWLKEYEYTLKNAAFRKSGAERETLLHNHRLCLEDVPFPYYGNPRTAKVVVLQANPGHDVIFPQRENYQKMMELDYQNLTHMPEIGIYSMTPEDREWRYTDGTIGKCWYWKRTRELREATDWERVAKGLMYMEMFPYRSVRLMYPKTFPPSQEYTFFLLREMLKKDIWVVITRMERFWLKYVPELNNYSKIVKLRSSQNVTLSSRNMKDNAFERIASAL
jgi:hypothetical protein